jgi:uncharacterized membrane protein
MADPQIPASEPPPPVSPVAEPSQPVSETTGLPRNIAAALATIFTLIGGVVFLVLERKDLFVRFYAVQSILLGAIACLVSVAVAVVNFIFSHVPLIGGLLNSVFSIVILAFWLLWLVVYIVAIVKAFMGKEWEIPYLGKLARKQSFGIAS